MFKLKKKWRLQRCHLCLSVFHLMTKHILSLKRQTKKTLDSPTFPGPYLLSHIVASTRVYKMMDIAALCPHIFYLAGAICVWLKETSCCFINQVIAVHIQRAPTATCIVGLPCPVTMLALSCLLLTGWDCWNSWMIRFFPPYFSPRCFSTV